MVDEQIRKDLIREINDLLQRNSQLASTLNEYRFLLARHDNRLNKMSAISEDSSVEKNEIIERYNKLINNIDEGYCTGKLIFSENHMPVDFLFLEANPAFEIQTGLKNVIGKTMRSVLPGVEQIWIDQLGQTALTGEPSRYKSPLALGQWSDRYAFRLGQPGEHKLGILFRTNAERSWGEDALNLNQMGMEALLKLSQMSGSSTYDLMKLAYREAIRLTGSNIGFIGFVNESSTTVDVYYWPETMMERCGVWRDNLTFPLAGAGMWAEAIRQNYPVLVNDYSAPHSMKRGLPDGHVELKNLLVVPHIENTRCAAVMAVANKDGDYKDLDVLQLNLLIGGLYKTIQRRRSEEHLRQSEERFKAIFDNCPVAMVVFWANSGIISNINPASERLFKCTKAEVIGKAYRDLEILATPVSKVNNWRNVLKRLDSGHLELDIRLGDGSSIRVMLSVTPLKGNAEGQVLATILDITDLRKMESEIARLDRLNLIGEMAASIGHEIRNPLTAIRGFLQILSDKDEYREDRIFFELMIEELDRANGIISEYLGLAKDKRVDLKPQSLNDIITSLYPIIQSDANYREINVRLELNRTPHAIVDLNEIRQLILNIARNGIEAMNPGGELTIGTMSEGSQIVLYIRDEGEGLPAEIKEKMGTPFLTTKDRGTGLGLAVCFSIAARHNATIDYKTGQEGTTFFLRFPIPFEKTLPL